MLAELESQLCKLDDMHLDVDQRAFVAEEWQSQIEQLQALPETPSTPQQALEELLVVNADSGTHSIIDIVGVATEPAFGKASPVPSAKLRELFGTVQPTKEMVSTHEDELIDMCDRWEAMYIILYREGQPKEICFAGASGD